MKLTNALKLNNVKELTTKAAMVAVLAGAAFLATPTKANAQVALGVRIGHARVGVGVGYVAPRPYYGAPYGPVYAPPVYAPPVYVAPAAAYGYYGPGVVYDRRGWDHRDRRVYR
jgi:hypothetical protein